MKKTLKTLLSLAVVAASLVSCKKETFKENSIPADEKIQVAVSGSIGEFVPADATKAYAESVVRVTWTENDKVYVYDGSACLGTLTVAPNEDNASHALLTGKIDASAATPSNLSLVYVKGAETAPAINDGKISVDISSQSATTVADVPFVLYATIAYDAEKLTKSSEFVPFSFATSVMTVNCTNLPVDAQNAKINITKAEIEGVSTACELTIDGAGVTAVSGTTPGTITRTAGFEQADSRGSFKIGLAADPATPAARNILVYQDSKVSGAAFTSTTLAEGNSYNTVYQMAEYISNTPDGMLSGEFTVDGNGKKVHFSKGNLWADGDKALHFEANQSAFNSSYESSHVSHFTWSDNIASAVSTSNSGSNLFCDESHKVSVDGGEAIYYALSIDEWAYLFSNHPYKWASVNGVKGYVIAPDDFSGELSATYTDDAALAANSLVFLPAAGKRMGSNVSNVGSYGLYWSSAALNESNSYNVYFTSSIVYSNSCDNPSRGFSVRLITECQ